MTIYKQDTSRRNSPAELVKSTSEHDRTESIRSFVDDHLSEMLVDLTEWIRLRSVAGDPECAGQMTSSAVWLADRLAAIGFPVTEVLRTGSSCAVFAEWCPEPLAPTVLVYSHHDVRAAKESNWDITDPFAPLLRDGRLYGRGSSDAKGQILAHLWGVRAHLATSDSPAPAVNLKFLIEGEEELGSPSLAELLDEHRDRLNADVIIFSDTLQWSADQPALCTSVRGMISATLTVHGAPRDVHSGATSGAASNAIHHLTRVLANLHDDEGRITLPGFYDDVKEPSSHRRQELADLNFDEKDWLRRSDTGRIDGEAGYTPLERLWLRPSLEVISVSAGDEDGLARAVIPAVAQAQLSIRIVEGQTCAAVADQLRKFMASRFADPALYELEVAEETAQEPYVTPDHPAVAALDRAMQGGHGVDQIGRMGNAGGGPAELLARTLHAPVVFYGTGLVEDHWHSSDESISVGMLTAGAATLGAFWEEAATDFELAVKRNLEEAMGTG